MQLLSKSFVYVNVSLVVSTGFYFKKELIVVEFLAQYIKVTELGLDSTPSSS